MNIAVAGTGYVGLSLAVLLSQHNEVTAVDIIPEKVEKLNNWQSPIQDDYIEKYQNVSNIYDNGCIPAYWTGGTDGSGTFHVCCSTFVQYMFQKSEM